MADTVKPKFAIPDRPSKLDPFAEKLGGWLKSERAKSRKQRRTLQQLHADLVALGFTGSCSRVAAFGFIGKSRPVSPTCLISVDRNHRSVRASFASLGIQAPSRPELLDGSEISVHSRPVFLRQFVQPRDVEIVADVF